jgi:hypothetical protein
MNIDYECLKCRHRFGIEVSDEEWRSVLDPNRTDVCPKCEQKVGTGPVRCAGCGKEYEVRFHHWHICCDAARGDCPTCGHVHIEPCIC